MKKEGPCFDRLTKPPFLFVSLPQFVNLGGNGTLQESKANPQALCGASINIMQEIF